MIKIERTITIHRPVEEVFGYLCDVEQAPSYMSGQRKAHKTSNGSFGIGTTFAAFSKVLRRRTMFEITEYELNSRLAWKAMSGARATTTWSLQPSGPSTRVTFTRVADEQGLSSLAQSLLQGVANGQVDKDLGALKELLAVTRKPAARGW